MVCDKCKNDFEFLQEFKVIQHGHAEEPFEMATVTHLCGNCSRELNSMLSQFSTHHEVTKGEPCQQTTL